VRDALLRVINQHQQCTTMPILVAANAVAMKAVRAIRPGVRRRTENWEWSPSPRPRGIHRLFAGWDRVAWLDNNHLIAITHAGRLSSTRLVDKTMDGPALE